jgi:hypothetical protein
MWLISRTVHGVAPSGFRIIAVMFAASSGARPCMTSWR